jgi:hypothetical protein
MEFELYIKVRIGADKKARVENLPVNSSNKLKGTHEKGF